MQKTNRSLKGINGFKLKTLAVSLSLALLLNPSMGEDYVFTPGEGDFFDPSNWGPNIPMGDPDSYDGWIFNSGDELVIKKGTAVNELDSFYRLSNVTVKVEQAGNLIWNLPVNSDGYVTYSDKFNLISNGKVIFNWDEYLGRSDEWGGFFQIPAILSINEAVIGDSNNDLARLVFKGKGVNNNLPIYTYQQYSGWQINSLVIGNGGKGAVEIDGTYVVVAPDDSYVDKKFLSVGNGGSGKISVLNGGKLSVGQNASIDIGLSKELNDPSTITYSDVVENIGIGKYDYINGDLEYSKNYSQAIIGENGGDGLLIVSGVNAETHDRSRSVLGKGASIGIGNGSKGYIDVKDGAYLQAFIGKDYYQKNDFDSVLNEYRFTPEESSRILNSSTIRLGIDGGYGHLKVSDVGSTVEIGAKSTSSYMESVVGELVVGLSGVGEITLHNGGQVAIGAIKEDQDKGFIFEPGKIYEDPYDWMNSAVIGEYYGKTVLAAGAGSHGILNFTGDNYDTKSVKASDLLLTSDISIGRGEGIININHNAGNDQPFIFDIQVSENYDKIYHSDFEKGVGAIGPEDNSNPNIGKISFNHENGMTLLKKFECRAEVCDATTPTFDYSGATNIYGGELQVEDANLLSQKSDFNVSGSRDAQLNIKGVDQQIKSLNNDGIVSLSESINKFGGTLSITGDYSGNGVIVLNTEWNTPTDPLSNYADSTSKTDQIHIKGNVVAGTHTQIQTSSGQIYGDAFFKSGDYYSLPVVIVEGDVERDAFYGTADMEQAGYQAKIGFNNKRFYWITTVSDEKPEIPEKPNGGNELPILAEKVSIITQMAHANHAQLRLSMGRYLERGNVISLDLPIWVRQYGSHSSLTGKQRFSYDADTYGIQMGYDLSHVELENMTRKMGVFGTYSHSSIDFKDKYRTKLGLAELNSDKKVGSGRSRLYGIGGYYSLESPDKSYVDVVTTFNLIENTYLPRNEQSFKQSGYAWGLSLEGGYSISLNDTNWELIPQAQLVYQYLSLKDKYVNEHKLKGMKGSMAFGRIGLQTNYKMSERFIVSGSLDFYQQLIGDKKLTYGNSRFGEILNKRWIEVGLSGRYNAAENITFFADVTYQKNLDHKKRDGYKGNIGLRVSF